MEYTLEDAVELTRPCCKKRALLLYNLEAGRQLIDERTYYLLCINCRTGHYWRKGESRAAVSGSRITNREIYDSMTNGLIWTDVLTRMPEYVDYFIEKLALDKSIVFRILGQNVSR